MKIVREALAGTQESSDLMVKIAPADGELEIVIHSEVIKQFGEQIRQVVEETLLTLPGNYPAFYASVRDALNGVGENPIPASQAIQIMELIELGIESAKHRATLCLA